MTPLSLQIHRLLRTFVLPFLTHPYILLSEIATLTNSQFEREAHFMRESCKLNVSLAQ